MVPYIVSLADAFDSPPKGQQASKFSSNNQNNFVNKLCFTFSHIYFKPLKLSCCVPIVFCLFSSSKCTIFVCKYCSKYHGVYCLILLHFPLLKRVIFDSKLDVGFLCQTPEFGFDVQARRYT